ncbi:Hypothetical predicted protein [Marmota monax]|uniref:Uncharacterized protein n=1 Tax=Marmota monax TaxID=9995 RepID=A0A5E4AFN4_MARMO|nr:Hypothetical predicted protein [Marmota monax]
MEETEEKKGEEKGEEEKNNEEEEEEKEKMEEEEEKRGREGRGGGVGGCLREEHYALLTGQPGNNSHNLPTPQGCFRKKGKAIVLLKDPYKYLVIHMVPAFLLLVDRDDNTGNTGEEDKLFSSLE